MALYVQVKSLYSFVWPVWFLLSFLRLSVLKDTLWINSYFCWKRETAGFTSELQWIHCCTCEGRFGSLHPLGCTGWKRWRLQERMICFNLLCATGHQNVPAPALFPYKQLSLLLWNCCMMCSSSTLDVLPLKTHAVRGATTKSKPYLIAS